MIKKVVAIGSCLGVEEILFPKGYVVEHVEQKSVLDVLKKEGIEAVIVDIDDTVRFNVVISGIRHLYPGLWITAISGNNNDAKERSLALKSGVSSYVKKPVTEKNLYIGEEERPVSETLSPNVSPIKTFGDRSIGGQETKIQTPEADTAITTKVEEPEFND